MYFREIGKVPLHTETKNYMIKQKLLQNILILIYYFRIGKYNKNQ